MDPELRKLSARRSPLRAGITRLLDTVQNLNVTDECSVDETIERLGILEKRAERLQSEIGVSDCELLSMIDADANPSEYEHEYNQIEDYRIKLDTIFTKLRKFGNQLQNTASADSSASLISALGDPSQPSAPFPSSHPTFPPQASHLPSSSNPSYSSDATMSSLLERLVQLQESHPENSVSLPKLQIKKFNGDVTQFVTFWDEFKSTVHHKRGLTDVQRFKYLKDLVVGDAARSIENIPLSEDNYHNAVKYLFRRFGDVETIIVGIFSKLLEFGKISKSNDVASLRNMIDKINNCVLTLESLKIDSQFYCGILYPLILRVLPDQLSLKFLATVAESDSSLTLLDLESNPSCDLPQLFTSRFEQLRSFLVKDVQTKERQSNICSARMHPTRSESQPSLIRPQQPYHHRRTQPDATNNYVALPSKFKGKKPPPKRPSFPVSCIFCNESHFSNSCSSNMSLALRKKTLVDKKACHRCLRVGHSDSTCTRVISCTCCGEAHYKILCDAPQRSASLAALRKCHLLPTGHLKLIGSNQNVQSRFLLDSGSSCSYISQRLFRSLNLEPYAYESLAIHVFGDSEPRAPQRLAKVSLKFFTKDNSILEFSVLVIPEITSNLLPIIPSALREQISHPICDSPEGPSEIDVLFGACEMMHIVDGPPIRIHHDLTLLTTLFGFVAVGSISSDILVQSCLTSAALPSKIDLTDFWSLDHMGILPSELSNPKVPEEQVIESFRKGITRTSSGRYSVDLNLNDKITSLSDNRFVCLKQFQSLIKKLNSNPDMKKLYFDEVNFFLEKGFAEILPPNEVPRYFLPHFPVVNPDKQSYKVRPVFNASSHARGKLSLNDCIVDTPNLLISSIHILVNFRRHRIALIADISKAYLMIEVNPHHRNFLCFFWLKSCSSEPCVFRMTSNTFGVKDSQFNAIMVIREHARSFQSKYPKAVAALLNDLYMDDLLTGADTEEEVECLKNQIIEILGSAKMELKKWCSNSPDIRFPSSEDEIALTTPSYDPKVLGIAWNSRHDFFTFRSRFMLEFCQTHPATKRTILGAAARLHDPLGLLSPFIINLKLLLQELHRQQLSFDGNLSSDLLKSWRNWQEQLKFLEDFKLNRCYTTLTPVSYELHCFCDASDKAYAAVIYLKSIDALNNSSSALVACKARVTPLKNVENFTIPRKELMAALCGVRLMKTIYSSLNLPNCEKFFWSDSQVVLHWIHSSNPLKWGIFVCNRLKEILQTSSPLEWSHCPGEINPADIPSRGCNLQKLINNRLWFQGPEFLNDQTYPKFYPKLRCDSDFPEVRQTFSLTASSVSFFDVKKYSSLSRVVRVFATIRRAATLFKCLTNDSSVRPTGPLLGSELSEAKKLLLIEAQRRCFGEDYLNIKNHSDPVDARFLQFAPFMDQDGLIRVGGRLSFLDESEDVKHPILLMDDPFVRLLILDAHARGLHHLRVDIVQSKLREQFWIMRSRQIVKSVLSKCLICRKYSVQSTRVEEAPLPPNRIEISLRPFKTVGVDYLGHFFVKLDASFQKVWIVIFCCSVTRAVYLDIVVDMTSYSFLGVLKRFIAAYGIPDTIVSDNALTFTKSNLCLKNLWRHFRGEEVQNLLGHQGIRWEFNAPRASWWGGQFERMVRVVKDCLRKTMKQQKLLILDFLTLTKEIEAAINCRPLSILPSDSDEPVALTPGHFLASKIPLFLPPGQLHSASDKPEVLRGLWKSRERALNGFWHRWKKEYLLLLRSAHKRSTKSSPPLLKNDVVLIKDDSSHRFFWKMGKIEEVLPGRDAISRTFRVKVGKDKFVVRAAQHLFKFEI